ncbi:MAG: hypothetical protein V2J19_05475 [Wenzhouxiangella sp.]|jgi:hypothetical protein|nr:hypothetical protein [Wenzhouxiangella sp.]
MYYLRISTSQENADVSFENILGECKSHSGGVPSIEPDVSNPGAATVKVPCPATLELAKKICRVLGEDLDDACKWEAPKDRLRQFVVKSLTTEQAERLFSDAVQAAGSDSFPSVKRLERSDLVQVTVRIPKGKEVVYHQILKALRDAGVNEASSEQGSDSENSRDRE